MTLDTLPPRRPDRAGDGTDAPLRPQSGSIRRVGLAREHDRDRGLPSRSLVLALVLACITLMVVDKAGGHSSPVAPVRRVIGEVFGPVESGIGAVVQPIAAIPGALRTNGQLRDEISQLKASNADLRQQALKAGYDDQRIAELHGLQAMAGDIGYALVPARVVGFDSAQSFRDTVTISAGSDAGLHPDMTVVAAAGLVGRVISVTDSTATVLLITDPRSTVGGRIGDNMQLGFVHGNGSLGSTDSLDLDLLDQTLVPHPGQAILTWGSKDGAPYVSGVPVGQVSRVYQSVRDTSYRAVLTPYVDFTSLDMVGVVVPSGTDGVIEPDGSMRGIGQ